MQARTHYYLLPVGLVGRVAEVSYCGPDAPRKIVDGAESTPLRTVFVSHLVRISNTYTEVLGNAGMWDMGKSESFLWFYTV
jgi:hypothetical protein